VGFDVVRSNSGTSGMVNESDLSRVLPLQQGIAQPKLGEIVAAGEGPQIEVG
jgi:hypothetical protein